jgi:hypothetical protein
VEPFRKWLWQQSQAVTSSLASLSTSAVHARKNVFVPPEMNPHMAGTRYETGDVVATPNGRGVVAAVLTEQFYFPQEGGDDEYKQVSATADQPAYVIGLETSGSAPYRASALEATDLETDNVPEMEGERLADIVDEDVSGLDDLPEGWDRNSVLEYWEEIGGSWEECVGDLTDEFDEERANQQCSAMKSEVLRTQRWRNRF